MRVTRVADAAVKVEDHAVLDAELEEALLDLRDAIGAPSGGHAFREGLGCGEGVELVGVPGCGDGVAAGAGDGFAVDGDGALEAAEADVAVGADVVRDGDDRDFGHLREFCAFNIQTDLMKMV